MERFNLSEKDAEQTIWKDDKRRADNYHYYTNRMLGAAGNFDITLNTELGSDYIFSLPTSSPQSCPPSSIRSPLNSIARSSSDLCLLLVVNLSYKIISFPVFKSERFAFTQSLIFRKNSNPPIHIKRLCLTSAEPLTFSFKTYGF